MILQIYDLSISNAGADVDGSRDLTTNKTIWDATIFGTVQISTFSVTASWNIHNGTVKATFKDGNPGDIFQITANVDYHPVNCSTLEGLTNPVAFTGSSTTTLNAGNTPLILQGDIVYNKCISAWNLSASTSKPWEIYDIKLSSLNMQVASTRVCGCY